jgi:hypothetical protein
MALAYKMIAERENESLNVERQSSLVIVAKARIFASEGWQVVITDADGKSYAPPEFDSCCRLDRCSDRDRGIIYWSARNRVAI